MKQKIMGNSLVDIIKYDGDHESLVWKHPAEDFRLGTQLIVHESQEAVFFKDGCVLDTFAAGRHTLEAQDMPLLDQFFRLPSDADQIFHSEIYYINLATQMGIKWETDSKIRLFDPLSGLPLEIGACGEFNIRVSNGKKLLLRVAGTSSGFSPNQLFGENGEKGYFRSLIITQVKTNLAGIIKEENIPILEIDAALLRLSELLRQRINAALEAYGLEITDFFINRILTPDEDPNYRRLKDQYAEQYLLVRQEEIRRREAEAAAERKTVEAQTQANLKRIEAQGNAEALQLKAAAEAAEMQMKGYIRVKRSGWDSYGWKIGVVCGLVLIACILLLTGMSLYRRLKLNQEEKNAKTAQTQITEHAGKAGGVTGSQTLQDEAQEKEAPALQGILAEFVSRVYRIPAKDVTQSQLSKIQQLTIRREFDLWHVGYSFETPKDPVFPITESGELFQNSAEGLTWIDFSSDAVLDLKGLVLFSGLKRLDVCGALSASDIKGLPLVSVSAYFDDPAQAASILENPGAITELGFHAGVESLKGIQQFENLETLYLDYAELDNIDALISLKHLKNLTLYSEETLTDFAVIGKLPELETLRLETYGLRGTDFLKNLPNLKQLEITGAQIHMLSGLENCSALETLSIDCCEELKDMTAVESLTGLQELALDMPYGCQEPNLESLTSLKKLSLSYVTDCSYLENLTALTELHLDGCALPETLDPTKLTSLSTLSLTFPYHEQELAAVERFPSLERIDLQGIEVYKDISGIFNMPHLRELNLRDVDCEIDFDAVSENPSLEILRMENLFLFKNIEISRDGIFTGIDYDEVSLEDHMAFFRKFPSLRELYLRGNELTDLSFVGELPTLEVLDISDNYITGLSPLAGLPSLKMVICGDNPLESARGLGDSVVVIDQPLAE